MKLTLWVDSDSGNDNNDGLTRNTPKKTVESALFSTSSEIEFLTIKVRGVFTTNDFMPLQQFTQWTQVIHIDGGNWNDPAGGGNK